MFGWLRGLKASRELAERVDELFREQKELRLDLDDLFDRFRRYQGRVARSPAPSDEPPAPPGKPMNGMPTVAQLRAAGRWRW